MEEAIGDSLPLAVANMFNYKVQIFSSNTESPIYEIKPNLSTEGTTENTINLAHTMLLGRDYYYATEATKKDQNANICDRRQALTTQDNSSTLSHSVTPTTPHKRAYYEAQERHHPLARG